MKRESPLFKILFLALGFFSVILLHRDLTLLVSALEALKMSYSSHNTISCERVEIFHSETYDVAEGSGALKEQK